MNSSYLVYSIILNIQKFCLGKNIKDVFTPGSFYRKIYNKRVREYFKIHYKRIYNEIENGYYNQREMALFCLYKFAIHWDTKPNIYEINQKNISEFITSINEKGLSANTELLKMIYKEFEFKSIRDFIKVKEDGTTILYILVKNGRISVLTYLKFIKKLLTDDKENDILYSVDLKRFNRISNKFYNTYLSK